MKPKAEAGTYAALAVGLAVLVACAGGIPQTTVTPTAMAGAAPAAGGRPAGFLTAATLPNALATIPPSPKQGDARNTLDWDIFLKTRALEGTDRWELAKNDDSYKPADILRDFSCSIGVHLTAENSPTLMKIIGRSTIDAGMAAETAKQFYKRTRPFQNNPGNICIDRDGGIAKSFDYPSGHASLGFMAGLVIAQLSPEHSTQALARGRAYGESRVVCGVHNMSAVEAGRTNAAGVFAALQSSTEYRDELDKARAELAAARAAGGKPDAASCAVEAELVKPLQVY